MSNLTRAIAVLATIVVAIGLAAAPAAAATLTVKGYTFYNCTHTGMGGGDSGGSFGVYQCTKYRKLWGPITSGRACVTHWTAPFTSRDRYTWGNC